MLLSKILEKLKGVKVDLSETASIRDVAKTALQPYLHSTLRTSQPSHLSIIRSAATKGKFLVEAVARITTTRRTSTVAIYEGK